MRCALLPCSNLTLCLWWCNHCCNFEDFAKADADTKLRHPVPNPWARTNAPKLMPLSMPKLVLQWCVYLGATKRHGMMRHDTLSETSYVRRSTHVASVYQVALQPVVNTKYNGFCGENFERIEILSSCSRDFQHKSLHTFPQPINYT